LCWPTVGAAGQGRARAGAAGPGGRGGQTSFHPAV